MSRASGARGHLCSLEREGCQQTCVPGPLAAAPVSPSWGFLSAERAALSTCFPPREQARSWSQCGPGWLCRNPSLAAREASSLLIVLSVWFCLLLIILFYGYFVIVPLSNFLRVLFLLSWMGGVCACDPCSGAPAGLAATGVACSSGPPCLQAPAGTPSDPRGHAAAQSHYPARPHPGRVCAECSQAVRVHPAAEGAGRRARGGPGSHTAHGGPAAPVCTECGPGGPGAGQCFSGGSHLWKSPYIVLASSQRRPALPFPKGKVQNSVFQGSASAWGCEQVWAPVVGETVCSGPQVEAREGVGGERMNKWEML